MEKLSSLIRSWLTKIKIPPKWAGWAVFLGITFFTCWYILNPLGESFISVAAIELRLEVPVFQRLELEFATPVRIKSCILGRPEIYTRVKPASSKTGHDMAVEGVLTKLKLENYYTNQPGPYENVQPITINFASGDHVEIARVSIDEHSVELEKFLKHHLKNEAAITKVRYFRHAFAQRLSPLNDLISNWILTAGFFWTIWICAGVISMELKAWLYSRSFLTNHIEIASEEKDLGKSAAARKRASDRCKELWSRRDARYKYQQALGPAAGFIMTVASLIYSLSSSKVDVQLLIGGMHIAMVSTFLGLFLRIVALEGERVSFQLLAREMSELDALNEEDPETKESPQ